MYSTPPKLQLEPARTGRAAAGSRAGAGAEKLPRLPAKKLSSRYPREHTQGIDYTHV